MGKVGEKMSLRLCSLISALLLLFSARGLVAQTADDRSRDEAGVRQAGKDYLAAMERGDTNALADFWTADGTYTDETGKTLNAHGLLAKDKATGTVARPPSIARDATIRFITDDVAVEEADCETAMAEGKAPVKGHYTALWVRQNDRWKLDSLKESRTATEVSGCEELASLDVFAGEWSGKINQSTVHISAKWDATKRFLHRVFVIAAEKTSLSGTQEIGWDPISQHIKSWQFLDDGSYGDGFWSLEGTVWMDISSRVLPDGKTSRATQVYKFPDKNTLIWKMIRGSVNGQPASDFEVVLKRS
jgi:ketosteroid isomerase-like protein